MCMLNINQILLHHVYAEYNRNGCCSVFGEVVQQASTTKYPVLLLVEHSVTSNLHADLYPISSRRNLSTLFGITDENCTLDVCSRSHSLFQMLTSAYPGLEFAIRKTSCNIG